MKRATHSRREFLQRGSAACAAAGFVSALGRSARADTSAENAAPSDARQAIACSRREAAEAARDILTSGGNAIDAAVAALLVQCVIEPNNVSLGGYGGSLVYYESKTGRVHTIDFDSRAPRKFDPDGFTEQAALHGYLAIATPGIVAGIELALARFGTLPFKTLARHAIELAENGTIVTPRVAGAFKGLVEKIDPVSLRAFCPQGPPAAGSTWVQADLGRFLRRLGDEGLRSFYDGDIAGAIVRQVQAGGGVLTEEDFRGFQATVVDPLHITYRGHDLYTPPPPSGGLTSLSILKTLEQFDVQSMKPWGAEYIGRFADASNLCWAERFQYIGDPEFVEIPMADMLSEKRAAERAESIRQGVRAPAKPPADESHTINLVVADKNHNVVSWTSTHGGDFGSHVAIEGLGLMLGHGMSRFSATKGEPNFPAPLKRPQHNMSPLVVLKGGKPVAGLGLVGGRFIVTVTAQLAVNLLDFKAPPQKVAGAPRLHTEGAEPILLTGMPPEIVDQLRREGRQVEVKDSLGGPANAIIIDAASGRVEAAASGISTGAISF